MHAAACSGLSVCASSDSASLSGRIRHGVQQFLESELLAGMIKLLRAQVVQMLRRPRAAPVVTPPVAQQESLDALAATAQILHRAQAGAHQIAHRFIRLAGHVHEGEFARAVEPRQREGVPPVGLHPVAALAGHERGGDDFARDLFPAQMPRQRWTS